VSVVVELLLLLMFVCLRQAEAWFVQAQAFAIEQAVKTVYKSIFS
jgi:hypothetical protein